MTRNLFEDPSRIELSQEPLAPGAAILRNFAMAAETEILSSFNDVVSKAPFRHMITPGGFRMSVAMTNCGALGWVTDRTGYRYDPFDPESGLPWPSMPESFLTLAATAAASVGFSEFVPDACLINWYDPGARLTLHQDKNEREFDQPIVSVSLGLSATFLFGGFNRADTAVRVKLTHGDVAVWGGPARLRYHGVLPLKKGHHALVGGHRINLTFRKAA
jgi:DNA oxidative demethylase